MASWDWTTVAVFGSAGVIFAGVQWWRHVAGKRAVKAFTAAAHELGMAFTPGKPGTMSGTVNDIEIAGTEAPGSGGKDGYRFRTSGLPPISLGGEGFSASRDDVKTGDTAFDRVIRVDGDEAVVLAVMDAHAREVVAKHVQDYGGTLRLVTGVLTLEYLDLPTRALRIVTDVHAVREMAEALGTRYQRKGRVRCLAENAMTDPDPAVRLRNLEVLVGQEIDENEFAVAALDAAIAHDDPRVRLLGAIGRGEDEIVRAIALEGSPPPSVRVRALGHLVAVLETGEAEALLLEVSRDAEAEVQLAVVEALGRVGTTRSVERLHALSGLLSAVGRAASEAASQIQGRLEGAAPGQLSIASDEGGAVSLAPTPGALSHAKKTDA